MSDPSDDLLAQLKQVQDLYDMGQVYHARRAVQSIDAYLQMSL
jgi:hypothetical protein